MLGVLLKLRAAGQAFRAERYGIPARGLKLRDPRTGRPLVHRAREESWRGQSGCNLGCACAMNADECGRFDNRGLGLTEAP